ncbi:MAG: TerC family protein [Alphaproteobacteria bacterium]|nr:TerC family protein [Alphaproteobacteria bacterium]MBU0797885.1 TerC family protein [Alphaproteobacteria bacterium]MBU0886163.1 TerC family protein [Alphaproteobacteria bacterium]MBU1812803.1 TerC family protein [Alphaproteobacteria bacterium]
MDSVVPFLTAPFLGTPLWFWLAFGGIVIALLTFDLGVLHKDQREIGVRESLMLSAGYIAVALLFGAGIWTYAGRDSGMEYLTGFLIEKSLSIDNIFVISMIFATLAIPRKYQHRVLFWGILGVILLRGLMIGAGAAAVQNFGWVMFIFGGLLALTGVKMLFSSGHDSEMKDSKLLAFLRRHLPLTDKVEGNHFFLRQQTPDGTRSKLMVTPLFVALIMIELIDLLFAIDSVPAIFAITTDPFVIYTSNIFAILGLRALYFALAAILPRFIYLKYGLSLVLVFIGGKIFYSHFYGKLDTAISLGVTMILIGGAILISLWKTRRSAREDAEQPAE